MMSTGDVMRELLSEIPIPPLLRVRQAFERPVVAHPSEELSRQLHQKGVLDAVHPGMSIAVGVGSRGITGQPKLVRRLLDELKARGARPFLIPAMGSHGGATGEGQTRLLENLGFSADTMGVPIRATMDVVQVGTSSIGIPVYLDRFAYEADGVVAINRVKPHTSFRGPVESGLMKIMAIGFGKQTGAEVCHLQGFHRLAETIATVGETSLTQVNVLAAVALVENAYHETARIQVLRKDEVLQEEVALLEEAKRLSPMLHIEDLDVLIIDEIGKDLSGTGFDTNVVGRYHTFGSTEGPNIRRIVVLDLTRASHGNANGIGNADFTTRRVFEKIRFDQMYPNAITSTVPESVRIPMVLADDRLAIQAAIGTCSAGRDGNVRMARIKNTLSLSTLYVSENLREEVEKHPDMDILAEAAEPRFTEEGFLV